MVISLSFSPLIHNYLRVMTFFGRYARAFHSRRVLHAARSGGHLEHRRVAQIVEDLQEEAPDANNAVVLGGGEGAGALGGEGAGALGGEGAGALGGEGASALQVNPPFLLVNLPPEIRRVATQAVKAGGDALRAGQRALSVGASNAAELAIIAGENARAAGFAIRAAGIGDPNIDELVGKARIAKVVALQRAAVA